MTGYTDTIRQWATDTRRTGILPNADGTGEIGLDSKKLGSRLAVRFTLNIELDRVTDIRYQVFGCGFSMAACAVAADMSIGYSLDEMHAIDAKKIDQALDGLPSDRTYCAELAYEALQAAARSAKNGRQPVFSDLEKDDNHGPRVHAEEPLYSLLINSQKPPHVHEEDRHLFACLLAVANQEPHNTAAALGLTESDVITMLRKFFPEIELSVLHQSGNKRENIAAEINEDVLGVLLDHVPTTLGQHDLLASVWLCYILATRAALAGHLWVAMGLFERPELTAAIRRHLPTLAKANNQNMRWKRYLFKQVCDRNGGTMCKAPNCGVCSDYTICFAEED